MMYRITVLLLLSLVTLFAQAERRFDKDILKETFGFTESTKATVELKDLHQGCPARDCIPSIDNPAFIPANAATQFKEDEPVMVVDYNGIQRAYSLLIMQYHEIVNDDFNGKPLAVTYCPLCASSVAFIPKVNGKLTTFGVSGVLHNSDLVMYDRETESLWGQITGTSIVGSQTGNKLERVYVSQHKWNKAKALFPNLQALLPPKNSEGEYTKDYYAKYKAEDSIKFPVSLKDARLMNKAEVFGFELDGQAVAVESNFLHENRAMLETINGKKINIVMKADGIVEVRNLTDKKKIVATMTYWFAWYNFHPQTLLFK